MKAKMASEPIGAPTASIRTRAAPPWTRRRPAPTRAPRHRVRTVEPTRTRTSKKARAKSALRPTTEPLPDPAAPTDLLKQDSQPTLPELPPFSSRALDFEEPLLPTPLESQMAQLMGRFAGVHEMLIGHAERESALHERRRGFRALPIDRSLLLPDYANKANIIADIVALVEAIEGEPKHASLGETL